MFKRARYLNALLLLLLLYHFSGWQLFFRASLPIEGQNALPKHKTYKFGILSMMSCLKMISWQENKWHFVKMCTIFMFMLLKMKVLISHRLCSFKGKFYNRDESQLQKIKVKKHQWCHRVLFNLIMSDDHVLLWSQSNCQRQMCILRKEVVCDVTALVQLPETENIEGWNLLDFWVKSKSWQMCW